MCDWISAGHSAFSALLPVVVGHEQALAFRRWTPDTPLFTDTYGIPTPTAGEFVQPQAILLPVNAFDASGFRIGYGGGYFDRTLAELTPRPLLVGVGFALARVETTYPQAHDVRLDAVVTESGVLRITADTPPDHAS